MAITKARVHPCDRRDAADRNLRAPPNEPKNQPMSREMLSSEALLNGKRRHCKSLRAVELTMRIKMIASVKTGLRRKPRTL